MANNDLYPDKQALDEVERWFDGDRKAAKAWQESLDAGGIIRSDLIKVAAQIDGMMSCGLTRDCLILLIQAKCPNERNGKPMPKAKIDQVLTALQHLKDFVIPGPTPPVQVVQIKNTSLKNRA